MRDRMESGKILLYHAVCEDRDFPTGAGTNVPAARFEGQIARLQKRFALVSLEEAIGEPPRGGRPAAAVTFDDGYGDSYAEAWPILKRREVPATFFLTVSQIGKRWEFPLGPYPGLDWDQIREMDRDPLISFGSHGMRHVDLRRLSPEDAAEEIKTSKRILEEGLGHPVRFFSYPHGSFTQALKERVRSAGYRAAFSVISENRDLYELCRILVSRKDRAFRFGLKMSSLYWSMRRIPTAGKSGSG